MPVENGAILCVCARRLESGRLPCVRPARARINQTSKETVEMAASGVTGQCSQKLANGERGRGGTGARGEVVVGGGNSGAELSGEVR